MSLIARCQVDVVNIIVGSPEVFRRPTAIFRTILLNMEMLNLGVAQILKPLGVSMLSIIMLIGIVALTTELTEYEEIAKIVVIPSLILLIIVTGYAIFKTAYNTK